MSMITRRVAWDPGGFSPGGWFDSKGGLTFLRLPPPSFARMFSFLQKFVARALPESTCGIQPCLDILCQMMSTSD